jgi:hypothetical protein
MRYHNQLVGVFDLIKLSALSRGTMSKYIGEKANPTLSTLMAVLGGNEHLLNR